MKNQLSAVLRSVTIKSRLMLFIGNGSVLSKMYNVECTRVLVTWQEFLPTGKEPLPDKAVIFFPGWPLRADSKPIQELSEELANNSGARAYVIHTRSEQIIPDSLYQEAQAVCQYIAEKEMKHVTLVGYSQGAIKAIDTIVLLQAMNPNIHIEGLILIVPVGLNEIESSELVRRYIVDFLFKTLLMILRESARRPSLRMKLISLVKNTSFAVHGCYTFFLDILKEARTSRLRYFSRLQNELKEMCKKSPHLDQLRVPIILIQGARDRVSDRDRIVAQASAKIAQARLQVAITEALPMPCKNVEEQILSEVLFPRSPYVKTVKAEKFGSHILPIFRSKSIARASFYLLLRSRRRILAGPPESHYEQRQPEMR